MAKQGNRDRPNPRHCPSDKLDNVMAASILGFHQGQRSPTASQGRIDDCKPKLRSAPLSQLAMQGASIDDSALATASPGTDRGRSLHRSAPDADNGALSRYRNRAHQGRYLATFHAAVT